MKVSIITVCYNAVSCIEGAIQSVLSQAYKDIEYIIVDGKSTDGTLDIIHKYKDRISVLISEKDNGIYDAMNKGIRIATGDIVYFLNSDDRLYDKNVVRDIISEFDKNPDAGIIYGKTCLIDVPYGLRPYIKDYTVIKSKLDFLNQGLCHQSIFARTWLFNRAGFFNVQYRICSDYDWLLAVYNQSIKMKYINRYIVTYYYQGHSHKNLNDVRREKLSIVYKNYSFGIFSYYLLRYFIIRNLNSERRRLFRYIKNFAISKWYNEILNCESNKK